MNSQHVKGGINQVKGRMKEEFGHATGNAKLEGEGVLDRMKGKVQESVGNVKDAAKKVIDAALNHDKKS
jgi:uncharacterized protein YjbJ (UPF0337 family)